MRYTIPTRAGGSKSGIPMTGFADAKIMKTTDMGNAKAVFFYRFFLCQWVL